MSNIEARDQAMALHDAFEFEPTSLLSYQSAGKLLALGDEAALKNCADLPASIDLTPVVLAEARARISGYLGAYVVEIDGPGDQRHHYEGDAILDLGEKPLLAREMLPPGYFHLPAGDWDSAAAAAELGELGGEFQKPRYFDYDASICAHSVNGKVACRQCLDACPAEAIRSLGDIIEVDPYLCQGGGSCSTVCPSGAIRYLYPNLRDNGMRLRNALACYTGQGGEDAIILFHAQDFTPLAYLEAYANLLPVAVEEVASVGMDLCLSALAYGAAQVVLYLDDQVPASSVASLEHQVDWVQELIIGLGLQSETIATCRHEAALASLDSGPTVEAAEYDMPPGKRNAILQALDHLVARLRPQAEWVDLPIQAPFGEAVIDAETCTLCMACVGACPGRALQDGSNREIPEVFFIESNCLQCGACVQTCPEDAISLAPRLLLQQEARNGARALIRDQPFACIACGKLFASSSVINKMQEKLKDHHMFSGERALDRLKMCEDCRVVDIVQDPEAMGGQFNPDKDFRQ